MRLTSTGLGIGTSSPAYPLDVFGSGGASMAVGASTGKIFLYADNAGSTVGSLSAIPMRFSVNGSERMRLDSAGNLGLGVTPSAWNTGFKALQIGAEGALWSSTSTAATWLTRNVFLNTSSSFRYIASDYANALQIDNDGAFKFYTAASGTAGNAISFTQAMTLDASGNLGVGTSSPSGKLHVNRSTTGVSAVFSAIDGTYDTAFQVSHGATGVTLTNSNPYSGAYNNLIFANSGAGETARIDSNGNLLVGGTSTGFVNKNQISLEGPAGYEVINHISGTSSGEYYLALGYNGSGIGSITQAGTTGVLFNVTSDQRLKENIQDADSASSLIDSLQVRKFDWKSDNSHQRYGFVAQELVTVAPEAVYQPTDVEQMMAVDYSKLVPMLVKEIQSLRQRLSAANL
jgi:hypothetical protein